MLKLPAPQATRPVNTSALVLMNEFWAQNAVMHYVFMVSCKVIF